MSDPNTKPATPSSPGDVVIDLVISFLAPMFLLVSNGDIQLARNAAIQTMSSYRVRYAADLILVAQVVAFGLAALGSLSLSMDDDLSPSMMLRLRGNANACNRSAEQNRKALHATPQAAPVADAEPPPAATQAQPTPRQSQPVPAQPAPAQPAAPAASPATADQQRRAAWAAAFTEVAREYRAELPNLPPEQRQAASIRAAALISSADALLSGADLSAFAMQPGPGRTPSKA